MLVKSFETNGKNTKNIVKLNLEQNIKSYVQRKQIFDNFMISLPDKT